jgi:hypothetical protein
MIWHQVGGTGTPPPIIQKSNADYEQVRRTRGPDWVMIAGPVHPVRVYRDFGGTNRIDCGFVLGNLAWMPKDRVDSTACKAYVYSLLAQGEIYQWDASGQLATSTVCTAERAAVKAAYQYGEFNRARNAEGWERNDCPAKVLAEIWEEESP